MRTELKLKDVIRFGRVSFKVTELVLTKSQIAQSQATLEQLKSGVFQVRASNTAPSIAKNQSANLSQSLQDLGEF